MAKSGATVAVRKMFTNDEHSFLSAKERQIKGDGDFDRHRGHRPIGRKIICTLNGVPFYG